MRCVHVQLCGATHTCTHILMPFYSSCHPPMSHYHYLICVFLLRVLLFEDDLLGSVNVLRGRIEKELWMIEDEDSLPSICSNSGG